MGRMNDNKATPPVVHHRSCRCERCLDARCEDRAGRELAYLEAMSGPVYGRLGLAKASPGSLRAIAKRYGRRSA